MTNVWNGYINWVMFALSIICHHWDGTCTVYPKKYAHGFCFAVLCCGYTLTDFPISIRLTSLALWQSNDCPSASKATLMNMDKYFMWIHYERLHNHNKAKHNKTMCIFFWIYCIYILPHGTHGSVHFTWFILWLMASQSITESNSAQFIYQYIYIYIYIPNLRVAYYPYISPHMSHMSGVTYMVLKWHIYIYRIYMSLQRGCHNKKNRQKVYKMVWNV